MQRNFGSREFDGSVSVEGGELYCRVPRRALSIHLLIHTALQADR